MIKLRGPSEVTVELSEAIKNAQNLGVLFILEDEKGDAYYAFQRSFSHHQEVMTTTGFLQEFGRH